MPTFQISDAPSQLQMGTPGADGTIPPAKASFTLRNMGPRAQTGRIRIEPQSGAEPGWFALTGAPDTSPGEFEKEFAYAGNEAIEVTVKPPATAKPGKYAFQIRVTAEQDPDTDFVLGPSVAFELTAKPTVAPPAKGKFPWWIVAVVAVVLLLVAGGVTTFFLLRPGKAVATMPDLAGERAEAGAFKMATLTTDPPAAGGDAAAEVLPMPHSVSFTPAREAGAAELTVLRSDPKAGKTVPADAIVNLTIQAPNGACSSLVCAFPGAIFPPETITGLAAEGFDVKYQAALSVQDGKVVLDAEKLTAIKNTAPPAPMVGLPDLTGQPVDTAVAILGGLGLGVQYNAVAEGAADGTVRRTDPTGGRQIEKGTTISVYYNPVPCVGRLCNIWNNVQIFEQPLRISPFMIQQLQIQPQ